MGTSDRLVSGLSLFHCGLWQLKTQQGRRTDPVTPTIHISELEAWAIVTFPPPPLFENWLYPENKGFSVAVSCCSRSDKTTLLNMSKPPPPLQYTHACREHDGCATDNLFTHTVKPSYLHTTIGYTFESLHVNVLRKYRHAPRENKKHVCWNMFGNPNYYSF